MTGDVEEEFAIAASVAKLGFGQEGAYALIQSTKPQSLVPGFNDSPAVLAAWMVEKF